MTQPIIPLHPGTPQGRRGRCSALGLALALLVAPLAGLANEAPAIPVVTPPVPAALTFDPADPADALVLSQTAGVFTLAQRFAAPLGLRGYLVTSELGQPVVLYTDPAGTHLVLGALLTAEGDNVALPVLNDYLDQHLLPSLYRDLGAATAIHQGNAHAPLLYVLFDPACPHCARLYRDLTPRVAAGEVAVRWIPVNTLGEDAAAARLAEAAQQGQGEAALAAALAGAPEERPAGADAPVSAAAVAAVARNQVLFDALGSSGTPQLFYQARSGGFQLVRGAPDAEELALILQSLAPAAGVGETRP